MDNTSSFHGSKHDGERNDSKTLTLSSNSTVTDALSPDVLTATSPLAPEESYQLVDFAHWGQRPRSGGGGSTHEDGDDDVNGDSVKAENKNAGKDGIYHQSGESGSSSQAELLPQKIAADNEEENGYNFNQKGHKRAWAENDKRNIEELPLASAIRLGNDNSMEDVPYPLPTSGFLPDITLNGSKDNSSRDIECDSYDPINNTTNDNELGDDEDDEDTQSIHSYDEEQIEAYDRRKDREHSQKKIPELSIMQNNEDVQASRKKSKSIFLNPSRMLKIPSISALVSSSKKKKSQVEHQAQPYGESDNSNIENDKEIVFPTLLSSSNTAPPTNDETSTDKNMLAIDLHHPFMSSGLDNGDNCWSEAPPYTQIEMIRLAAIISYCMTKT